MNKLLLCAVAALPMMAMAQPAQAQRAGDKIAGRYICVFNKNMVSRSNTPGEAKRAVQSQGGGLTHVLPE